MGLLQASVITALVASAFFCALPHLTPVRPIALRYPALRALPEERFPLKDVQYFFGDDPSFRGAESFVFEDSVAGAAVFYTGLADGRIVKVFIESDGKASYEVVVRTGRRVAECGSLATEHICGRPLGMRRHPSIPHRLIVADAYMGLLQVNTNAKTVKTLVNASEQGFVLMNDLDLDAEKGLVYFSHTGPFPRNQIQRILLEGRPTGSVWAYNLDTEELKPLATELVMPNGVQLTEDRRALLVCSTALSAVYKISTETGEVNIINDDLQGGPDNIRMIHRNDRVSYTVALGSKRALPFSLPQIVAPFPIIRQALSLLDIETTAAIIPKAGLFVEIDEDGQELSMFEDPTAESHWYSEVEYHDGYFYLGS